LSTADRLAIYQFPYLSHSFSASIQLFMAKRAKAHIRHVHGAYPSMIEHPEATVDAILAAIAGTK
jgi:hypothetical protein